VLRYVVGADVVSVSERIALLTMLRLYAEYKRKQEQTNKR
jgi:hypothetical protein